MISGVVMGVPCCWIPPPAVSVPGIRHVSEEGPRGLCVSLRTQQRSQRPAEAPAILGFQKVLLPAYKEPFLYVTGKT